MKYYYQELDVAMMHIHNATEEIVKAVADIDQLGHDMNANVIHGDQKGWSFEQKAEALHIFSHMGKCCGRLKAVVSELAEVNDKAEEVLEDMDRYNETY